MKKDNKINLKDFGFNKKHNTNLSKCVIKSKKELSKKNQNSYNEVYWESKCSCCDKSCAQDLVEKIIKFTSLNEKLDNDYKMTERKGKEQNLPNNLSNTQEVFCDIDENIDNSNLQENSNVCKKVEESLRKKFHKTIFTKFCQGINEYNLILPNDKIAVCISGGKDSMLMAKLFQELKRHNKFNFELIFLVMDPGYNELNRKKIEENASMLNVPIQIFNSNIFDDVFNIEKSPCYVCARMRRGYLYSKAKELGCNKIALGHHFDDVIETILMGMLYGGQIQTMMPKLHSTNFEGMELIRPMYLIREKDIITWRDYNNLKFIECACKFTDNISKEEKQNQKISSKRFRIKQLIKLLSKEDEQIEKNIFRSVENVNLSTIIAYKDKNGNKHFFEEDY